MAVALTWNPAVCLGLAALCVAPLAALAWLHFRRRWKREARQQSAEVWERTFDSVPDLICVVDRERRIVQANRAFQEKLGMDASKIQGLLCEICGGSCDARAGGGGGDCGREARFFEVRCGKFGDDYLATCRPFLDGRGRREGSVCVLRDITARKQGERLLRMERDLVCALRDAEGLDWALGLVLAAALEAAGVGKGGIYLMDKGTGDLVLREARGMGGESGAAMARFPRHSALAHRIAAGETIEGPFAEIVDGAGELGGKWGRVLIAPIREERRVMGCVAAALGTAEAVPESARNAFETVAALAGVFLRRWHGEAALVESERRLRTLMSNLPGMAYRCLNLPRWPMVFVSEGCLDLTGYRAEELLDMGEVEYGDLIHAEDRQAVWDAVQAGVASAGPFELEYRIQPKGGGEKWVWERGRVAGQAEGEPAALEGFITDITGYKLAERERLGMERRVQQAQKMESLGVLAGGIAHDFNNILTSILGNADLALMDLSPVSPARGSLSEIVKAARHAAALCREMLAYSGKGRFVVESIHLGDLIGEMLHLVHASLSKKAVLKVDLDPGLPPMRGDAAQIRQVVMNLIVNASEAVGERGGAIHISTGTAEFTADLSGESFESGPPAAGRYVWIEVADTGCGMDARTRARLFEPFYTTKFTGRGLGLSAVLGIVRGHKGAIQVRSEEGKGTVFRVFFPAAEAGVAGAAGLEEEPGAGKWKGAGTLLLVDDEESVRAVARSMLERLGFHVLTAADGVEAVETFLKHGPEIRAVLLDLTMPHMDGEETFRELRRLNRDVAVLIASGYTELELAARFAGGDNGLPAFVQKPFTQAALARGLQAALASHPGGGGP